MLNLIKLGFITSHMVWLRADFPAVRMSFIMVIHVCFLDGPMNGQFGHHVRIVGS